MVAPRFLAQSSTDSFIRVSLLASKVYVKVLISGMVTIVASVVLVCHGEEGNQSFI